MDESVGLCASAHFSGLQLQGAVEEVRPAEGRAHLCLCGGLPGRRPQNSIVDVDHHSDPEDRTIGPNDERALCRLCLCKAREPSRAHLTWTCFSTAEIPSEERLMAKSVPQWPPAPISLNEADFVEQLAEDACSVVFPGGRGGGCGDASEDQTPFRAELRALAILFQAMLKTAALTASPPSMHWQHRRLRACRFLRLRRPRA